MTAPLRELAGVRAVAFDLVGTLAHVQPSVGAQYRAAALAAATAHREPAPTATAERFDRAFFAALRATAGPSPSSDGSDARRFWRSVVHGTLSAVAPPSARPSPAALDQAFEALWTRFATAAAWRLDPDVLPLLADLRTRGYQLAVLSNFDARLGPLLEALGVTPLVDAALQPDAVGAAKPDPRAFAALGETLGVPASATLFVGDSLRDDVRGATDAGLTAAWFQPQTPAAGWRPATDAHPGHLALGSLGALSTLLPAAASGS